jgi:ANTAR domain-containing protein
MSDPYRALTRLAQAIAADPVESPLSLRMCQACVGILGMDGGSLTLDYTEQQRVTLCATDGWAAELEDLQEVVGEGPSWDAYGDRSIQMLLVDGVAEARWPLLSEGIKRGLGRCAVYAIPIKPGPQTIGVATFYQREPTAMLVDDQEAQLLIDAVGVALVKDPDILADDSHATAESWNSRARVHQATGMVMAQLGLGSEDGIAVLRAHAYAHQQSLTALSDDIITRRLDFRTADPDPDPEGGTP